jgi:hypothetical protein
LIPHSTPHDVSYADRSAHPQSLRFIEGYWYSDMQTVVIVLAEIMLHLCEMQVPYHLEIRLIVIIHCTFPIKVVLLVNQIKIRL